MRPDVRDVAGAHRDQDRVGRPDRGRQVSDEQGRHGAPVGLVVDPLARGAWRPRATSAPVTPGTGGSRAG